MRTVKYTITKFDSNQKLLVVTFEDGAWAEIRLTNPLPKNQQDLEDIIKRFSAPKEAIEAQINPDADLSYIDNLIGVEKECERFSLAESQKHQELLDADVESKLKMAEEINFQKRVGEALVKLGVIENNPSTIPTSTL